MKQSELKNTSLSALIILLTKLMHCSLYLIILGLLISYNTYALNTATITVGQEVGKPGESVIVSISLDSNPGIAGLSIQVKYDDTRLRIESQDAVTNGAALGFLTYVGLNDITCMNNPFTVLWYGATNSTRTGTLLNVKFTILDEAPLGIAYVTVICEPGGAVDMEAENVLVSITQGNISVSYDSISNPQNPSSGISQPPAQDASIEYVDRELLPPAVHARVADNRVFTILGEMFGTTVSVSIPYTIVDDGVPKSPIVYRIEEDGSVEIVENSRIIIENETIEFTGTVGGLYFIEFIPETPLNSISVYLYIGIIGFVLVFGLGACLLVKKRKAKNNILLKKIEEEIKHEQTI